MEQNIKFREMQIEDCQLLLDFIKSIAKYEKMEDQVQANVETLKQQIFEEKRAFVFFIQLDNKEIGYVIYFFNFSTFVGHKGLYLEDLYIYPEYRHMGIGKKALKHLASIAYENHCGRIEWTCLNWNVSAQNFYKSIGAKAMDEWMIFRLDEKGIAKLKD